MFELFGFDHIQIAIPKNSETEARRFYGEVLLLTEVTKPQPLAQRGGLWFLNQKTHIHLGIKEPFIPEKKAHPAILVSNLKALITHLENADLPYEIDKELPDRFRIYVFDPFGNRLEFIQNGDDFTQR